MKKFVNIPKSIIKQIKDQAKAYCGETVKMYFNEYDDCITIELYGMGLMNHMTDPLKGTFSRFLVQDFMSLGTHDCFKNVEVSDSAAMVILSFDEVSYPSIEFTFVKQTVAINRH